jgi:hypothetical protein
VRQEARLLEHRARRFGEIGQCGLVTQPRERFTRDAVTQLRLVAEREQRFLAARGGARSRDREDLLEREIGCLAF